MNTHSLAFVQVGRGLGGGYRRDPSPRVAENRGPPRGLDEYDTLGSTSLTRVAGAKHIRPHSLPDKMASDSVVMTMKWLQQKNPAFQ